jgi:hypothetical protein
MKTVIQILLGVIIVYLAYLAYDSIAKPIAFKKEQTKRYAETVQRLKDIRTAELAYKDVNKNFTGSFDTLIGFVKNGKFPVVRRIGEIPEDLLGKVSEKEAIAKGMIIRDTTLIPVIDSLYADNFPIDSLRFIPYSGGVQFRLGIGVVATGSGLNVKVFEAKAPSKYILKGMDQQEVINLNDGAAYPGLKVGSLTEANNAAGNWE